VPLLIFPCTIKSRSSLLAPAHPNGPGKRAVKRLWWWWLWDPKIKRGATLQFWGTTKIVFCNPRVKMNGTVSGWRNAMGIELNDQDVNGHLRSAAGKMWPHKENSQRSQTYSDSPTPFISFLMFVVDMRFLARAMSASQPLPTRNIHMNRYGAPETSPFYNSTTEPLLTAIQCITSPFVSDLPVHAQFPVNSSLSPSITPSFTPGSRPTSFTNLSHHRLPSWPQD